MRTTDSSYELALNLLRDQRAACARLTRAAQDRDWPAQAEANDQIKAMASQLSEIPDDVVDRAVEDHRDAIDRANRSEGAFPTDGNDPAHEWDDEI